MSYLKNLITKYKYWKLKRKLIVGYQKEIEVDEIMEKWITQNILGGAQNRRKELVEKQQKISELKRFIDFLKTI